MKEHENTQKTIKHNIKKKQRKQQHANSANSKRKTKNGRKTNR